MKISEAMLEVLRPSHDEIYAVKHFEEEPILDLYVYYMVKLRFLIGSISAGVFASYENGLINQ